MSRRSRAARNKEQMRKREPGPYIAMPFEVGRSIEYWGLSAQAMRVLNYLWFAQYNGQNNGDLSAAYSQMRERGFKSRDTVWRALRELEEKGWIVRTRQGGRHRCTLWALTMCALDYDPKKMEIPRAPSRGVNGATGRRTAFPLSRLACQLRCHLDRLACQFRRATPRLDRLPCQSAPQTKTN